MATDLLVCCERLDESKYWHKCACPTAVVECESNAIVAELCGHSEFTGDGVVASTPPLKYLVKTWSGLYRYGFSSQAFKRTFTGTDTYDSLDCSRVNNLSYTSLYRSGSYGGPCVGDDQFYGKLSVTCHTTLNTVQKRLRRVGAGAACPPIATATICTDTGLSQLSDQDTEANAIARETPTVGTSCSSLWETRVTGFSFTYRTSEYTIECADLVIGAEYEVTPAIRRRTATTDATGSWVDVTVAAETFTATAKTYSFPSVLLGDDGSGEITQGYQYEITGVNIEKKA